MRLVLAAVSGLLVHFNGRSELHGEEREPAGDITMRATVHNDFCDQLHPTLRSALFFQDSAQPLDLADKGLESGKHWPHRRFAANIDSIRWADEQVGGKFTIHHGIGKSDLVLAEVKIGKLKLTPKDGGMVEIEFQVQAKPDPEKQAGKLYAMIQKPVSFSVEPPALESPAAA